MVDEGRAAEQTRVIDLSKRIAKFELGKENSRNGRQISSPAALAGA